MAHKILRAYGIPGGGECCHVQVDFTSSDFDTKLKGITLPLGAPALIADNVGVYWENGPGIFNLTKCSSDLSGRLLVSLYSVFHGSFIGSFVYFYFAGKQALNVPNTKRCQVIMILTVMPLYTSPDNTIALSTMPTSLPDDGITICVESDSNKKLFAHKTVLCENSEVFARMFKGQMKEAQEQTVTLKDTTYVAAKILIEYLYTELVDLNSQQDVLPLLSLATQYQIHPLVEICDYKLSRLLSKDDFYELALITRQYQCPILSFEIARYIKANYKEVEQFLPEITKENHNLSLAMAKILSGIGM
eukprot:TRINITY_DN2765_c0_g2_i2.p1 TRINITY_DN2765_c0_g2~~TRINITY_DN2765_c0_g2_i2.p1  ORF type:complete len:304 (-),score=39.90 TRINITY_DN2765_c0_g2_i2:10-921(-)